MLNIVKATARHGGGGGLSLRSPTPKTFMAAVRRGEGGRRGRENHFTTEEEAAVIFLSGAC